MLKRSGFTLFAFVMFLFGLPTKSFADDMRYTITFTSPNSGSTNVPQNLENGQTGSVCTKTNGETVCSIRVGLGIDANNSVKGVGYPKIDTSTLNSSTVQVSSSNDSGLSVIWAGSAEGVDADFKFYITTNTNPNGTVLMPNATYTIRLKGGSNGLKAKYQGNGQTYEAYLAQDYTWNFTTANGSIPARTSTQSTSNPASSPNISSGGLSLEERERLSVLQRQQELAKQNQPTPSPSPSPTIKPITKKVIVSPSPSPTIEPNESPESTEVQITPTPTPKPTLMQSVKNFFVRIFDWFRSR